MNTAFVIKISLFLLHVKRRSIRVSEQTHTLHHVRSGLHGLSRARDRLRADSVIAVQLARIPPGY